MRAAPKVAAKAKAKPKPKAVKAVGAPAAKRAARGRGGPAVVPHAGGLGGLLGGLPALPGLGVPGLGGHPPGGLGGALGGPAGLGLLGPGFGMLPLGGAHGGGAGGAPPAIVPRPKVGARPVPLPVAPMGGGPVPGGGLPGLGGLFGGSLTMEQWTDSSVSPQSLRDPQIQVGSILETVTFDGAGNIDGTALVVVSGVYMPDTCGRFLEVRFGGASSPAQSSVLGMIFPGASPPGTAMGVLHLCAGQRDSCTVTAPGRHVIHGTHFRLRGRDAITEAWALDLTPYRGSGPRWRQG